MDQESVGRLRFDRRLQRRRDWLDDGEYQTHTEALPDVSDKMTRIGDEAETAEARDVVSPSAQTPSSTFPVHTHAMQPPEQSAT